MVKCSVGSVPVTPWLLGAGALRIEWQSIEHLHGAGTIYLHSISRDTGLSGGDSRRLNGSRKLETSPRSAINLFKIQVKEKETQHYFCIYCDD